MRIPVLVFVCLFGIIHVAAVVEITEFCPDPYQFNDADEYIVISGNGSLDNITVSDGEGGFRFPSGSILQGNLVIARSAVAYQESHGTFPDYEWTNSSPDVPDVIGGRPLRLANTRDELYLHRGDSLIQNVSWPGNVYPREGQVHYLENGVWDRRILMLGQSRFGPAVFRNVSVKTFVSPDCSDDVFSEAVEGANRSIFVNVYEFSSPAMGSSLIAAKGRGVDVQVLVEGGPVGGISPAEKSLIDGINRSGIPVRSMVSTRAVHAPYRYDHAKYMIIDGRATLLTSENFKNSGFPPRGMSGNRGWGVYLEDPALAEYFNRIFLSDFSGPSVVPYNGTPGESEPPPFDARHPEYQPAQFTDAMVTPVIAPDTSDEIRELLENATSSIEIEQAYITNETPGTLNPFLATAINASRRGVHVRVLLDSYWYNTEDANDNDEMVSLINHIAASEHLPLEAKCIDLSVSEVEKIHNKGVIVDGTRVLVSSINWNRNSPNFNRESGVIIDHPGVARYFLQVFEDDWSPMTHRETGKTDYLRVCMVILVLAILVVVYLRRRRM